MYFQNLDIIVIPSINALDQNYKIGITFYNIIGMKNEGLCLRPQLAPLSESCLWLILIHNNQSACSAYYIMCLYRPPFLSAPSSTKILLYCTL